MRARALEALVGTLVVFACQGGTYQTGHSVPGGDTGRGQRLIAQYGCGGCHDIPGVRRATGTVGPPLEHFDQRGYIAGVMPNELESLMRWIMAPQSVLPGNAMPDMDIPARDARDISAYLYTLR